MKDIYIIGAGTYGEVMFELATDCGYSISGFYDDNDEKIGTKVMGVNVIGKPSELKRIDMENRNFIVAIGDNQIRCKIMNMINLNGGITPTLIHPLAKISQSAKIGNGVYIQMGAVIWTKVQIGDFVIISPNTVIAHHSKIGKACLISTMCAIGANITVGDYSFFGFGSIAITGIRRVGKNVYLGANTTVIDDTEDNVLMVGSPARKVKERQPII